MLIAPCRLVMWMWWYPKYVFSHTVGSFWLPTAFHHFLWNVLFWSLKSVKKYCDTSRLRAWRLKRRHQWRLPELSEQQTSQGRPKDGEAHGDNPVPEPELPGGHVMVQQEKRKHGHCTLLTCERSNGTDGWDQIRDQGRSWQTGDEKLDEKGTRYNIQPIQNALFTVLLWLSITVFHMQSRCETPPEYTRLLQSQSNTMRMLYQTV